MATAVPAGRSAITDAAGSGDSSRDVSMVSTPEAASTGTGGKSAALIKTTSATMAQRQTKPTLDMGDAPSPSPSWAPGSRVMRGSGDDLDAAFSLAKARHPVLTTGNACWFLCVRTLCVVPPVAHGSYGSTLPGERSARMGTLQVAPS